MTARAGNRRFWPLSALRAHTKAPYKTDLHSKMLMALKSPGTAWTVGGLQARAEARLQLSPKPEIHRVDAKFSSRPSGLTENPY